MVSKGIFGFLDLLYLHVPLFLHVSEHLLCLPYLLTVHRIPSNITPLPYTYCKVKVFSEKENGINSIRIVTLSVAWQLRMNFEMLGGIIIVFKVKVLWVKLSIFSPFHRLRTVFKLKGFKMEFRFI